MLNKQRILFGIAIVFLFINYYFLFASKASIDLNNRLASPSFTAWFGTDWLGRDLFYQTAIGLFYSLKLGISAAIFSGIISFIMALLASTYSPMKWGITLLIDILLSIPHLLLLIVLVLAFQNGSAGVITAVVITHWPKLTRILCNEFDGIKSCQFVALAHQFGQSPCKIIYTHIVPFIIPQWLVGTLLMVPHIIMHVAGLTFLGFGVDPTRPSIGLLLSDASRYIISGQWWLAVFPGLALISTLLLLSWATQYMVAELKRRGI